MAKKDQEELDEPTLEDLEEEDSEEIEPPAEEEEKEEVGTDLEARVETDKKSVEDVDEAEAFITAVAENRNVKKSDLKLDEGQVEDIQADEFTCSVCYLVLRNTALAKPRAKVCVDCV